jgi:drug/metabolite transporter (DMT)-like permease
MPLGIAQWVTPNRTEWLWIAATGVLAMGAQLLMTFSLRWVDAMTVGVISQLAVLVSMTLGVLLLGDHLSITSALGSALCIGGVAGVTFVTSIAKPVVAATEVVPES